MSLNIFYNLIFVSEFPDEADNIIVVQCDVTLSMWCAGGDMTFNFVLIITRDIVLFIAQCIIIRF